MQPGAHGTLAQGSHTAHRLLYFIALRDRWREQEEGRHEVFGCCGAIAESGGWARGDGPSFGPPARSSITIGPKTWPDRPRSPARPCTSPAITRRIAASASTPCGYRGGVVPAPVMLSVAHQATGQIAPKIPRHLTMKVTDRDSEGVVKRVAKPACLTTGQGPFLLQSGSDQAPTRYLRNPRQPSRP